MCMQCLGIYFRPVKLMALRRCLCNPRLPPPALPFSLKLVLLLFADAFPLAVVPVR